MNYTKGSEGEQWCLHYLERKGYRIVARNFHSRWGEIDLIAQDGEFVVFVEVKTRTGSMDSAVSSVSHEKIRRLVKTAGIFLQKYPEYANSFTRFDVIALVPAGADGIYRVRHLQDAFRAD
jgi:putative endonuclease